MGVPTGAFHDEPNLIAARRPRPRLGLTHVVGQQPEGVVPGERADHAKVPLVQVAMTMVSLRSGNDIRYRTSHGGVGGCADAMGITRRRTSRRPVARQGRRQAGPDQRGGPAGHRPVVMDDIGPNAQNEDEIERMVAKRMQRQQVLYQPAKRVQVVMLEGALRARVVSVPTLASQLDRLLAVIGLSALELSIIPREAAVPVFPLSGFRLYDDLVIMESILGSSSSPRRMMLRAMRSTWSCCEMRQARAPRPQR
jgi:Domain of unknown function (DUF5753)